MASTVGATLFTDVKLVSYFDMAPKAITIMVVTNIHHQHPEEIS